MSDIDNVIKSLNKQFKTDIMLKGKETKERTFIPFTSPKLNYLTRGGVCEGKMVEFFGKEGSAKTTLALDVIKNFQKIYPDKLTTYLDAENTLDCDWAEHIGVDMEKVILIKPDEQCGETLLDMVNATISSGSVGMVVVDSIPFLPTKMEFEADLNQKSYGGNSALMTQWCRKVTPLQNRFNTTIICINQMRDNLSSPYGGMKTPGGRMLMHTFVQRFNLSKSKFIDDNGNELTNSCEFPSGHIIDMKVEKNKVTKNDRRLGNCILNYSEGFDVLRDTVSLAVELGTINKSGAWFSFLTESGEEIKYQGQARLVNHLKEHQDQLEYIKKLTLSKALE